MIKAYSIQIMLAVGFLAEILLNGLTWWMYYFTISFIGFTIYNFIAEIKG